MGMTHIQLRELFDFANKNGKIEYQVYSTNTDDTYGPYWEWMALSEGVINSVKAKLIVVSNFRTVASTYASIREPRHRPVTLYPMRKTGKRYNHTKTIDLYRANTNFNKKNIY